MSAVDRAEHRVGPKSVLGQALVGEAMIERAKSVIVVAWRVDEDQAAQILSDAAIRADIPVRVAADQVMTALRSDAEDVMVQNTLVRALGAVHPVDQPASHDWSPAPRPGDQVA